jgi:hypothetical protein
MAATDGRSESRNFEKVEVFAPTKEALPPPEGVYKVQEGLYKQVLRAGG